MFSGRGFDAATSTKITLIEMYRQCNSDGGVRFRQEKIGKWITSTIVEMSLTIYKNKIIANDSDYFENVRLAA